MADTGGGFEVALVLPAELTSKFARRRVVAAIAIRLTFPKIILFLKLIIKA